MNPEADLLQRYAVQHDERAFRALVEKHLDLVYAAALRRTGGRAHLAEEVCQKVFTDLARKAASLHEHPALTAWLHRSTRYAAIDAIRAEARRQKLQETFAAMPENEPDSNETVEWEKLRPVLDEAMDQLKESDRSAMFLRYFEGLGFADVGQRLGLSENAARMRTERALDKLRLQLSKRGVTSTGAALGLMLASRASAAAPAGLAGNVTTLALTRAAEAGSAGLFAVLAGSRLVFWGALAVGIATTGVLGWRWAGARRPRPPAPQMALAADGFASNALEVYRIMALVHPVGGDQPAGGGGAAPQAPSTGSDVAAARDVMLDFSEASRARNVPRLAQLVTFDAEGAEVALKIYERVPPSLRDRLRTPEELFAFFYATDTLLSPVPPAKFLETFIATEMKPGRAAVHRPGTPPRGLEFVLTREGWKHEIPTRYLPVLADRILSNETLAKLNALPEVRAHASVGAPAPAGSARAALVAYAAACNRGEVAAVTAMLRFDPAARGKALAFMDTLPATMKGKWRGPEELAADMLVNGAMQNPFPTETVLVTATEERLNERRVALLLPGATRDRFEFERTDTGWQCVITEPMVDGYLRRQAQATAPGQ